MGDAFFWIAILGTVGGLTWSLVHSRANQSEEPPREQREVRARQAPVATSALALKFVLIIPFVLGLGIGAMAKSSPVVLRWWQEDTLVVVVSAVVVLGAGGFGVRAWWARERSVFVWAVPVAFLVALFMALFLDLEEIAAALS